MRSCIEVLKGTLVLIISSATGLQSVLVCIRGRGLERDAVGKCKPFLSRKHVRLATLQKYDLSVREQSIE